MRKVILHLHMSLDTVISGLENWLLMTDEIIDRANKYYEDIDTIIFGSKTYPSLAEYWINAETESSSEVERSFSKKINEMKKYVLTRSSVDIVWKNSEVLKIEDEKSLVQKINELKNQEGKNISVESGLGVWQLFLDNQLFDELFLYIHPVVVGKGDKLFIESNPLTKLTLESNKVFDNGVIELRYKREY